MCKSNAASTSLIHATVILLCETYRPKWGKRTVLSRSRVNKLSNTKNAKVTSGETLAWVSGLSGRSKRKYISAAAVVSAFFLLGAYTAGADSKDPETTFIGTFNDVLFVGVAGAAINNASIENALTDDVSIEGALLGNVAKSESADNLVARAQSE